MSGDPATKEELKEMRDNCRETHKDLNDIMTQMAVTLGRVDERMEQVFGKLNEGGTTFRGLDARVHQLESESHIRKSAMVIIIGVLTIGLNLIIFVVQKILEKIVRGGN